MSSMAWPKQNVCVVSSPTVSVTNGFTVMTPLIVAGVQTGSPVKEEAAVTVKGYSVGAVTVEEAISPEMVLLAAKFSVEMPTGTPFVHVMLKFEFWLSKTTAWMVSSPAHIV